MKIIMACLYCFLFCCSVFPNPITITGTYSYEQIFPTKRKNTSDQCLVNMLYPDDINGLYLIDNSINVEISSPNKKYNDTEFIYGYFTLNYTIYNDLDARVVDFRMSNPGYNNYWINNLALRNYAVNGIICSTPKDIDKKPEYSLSIQLAKGQNTIEIALFATVMGSIGNSDYGHYTSLDFSDNDKWNMDKFNKIDIKIHYLGDYLYIFNGDGDFDIVGEGKKQGSEFYLKNGYIHYMNKRFPKISIKIHGEVLVPCERLPSDFTIYNDELTATDYMKIMLYLENTLNQSYKLLHAESLILEVISQLNKSQLRLLRNAYFANRGYVFKHKDLLSFFNTGISYYPDPTITADIVRPADISKVDYIEKAQALHCGFMLDAIVAAENGNDPRIAFERAMYGYYKNKEDLVYRP